MGAVLIRSRRLGGRAGGRMDVTKEYVGAFRDYANAYKSMLRIYDQHKL